MPNNYCRKSGNKHERTHVRTHVNINKNDPTNINSHKSINKIKQIDITTENNINKIKNTFMVYLKIIIMVPIMGLMMAVSIMWP